MNMHFIQDQYWPGIFLAFVVFLGMVFLLERRFYSMVKKYWFFDRSFFSYISSFFFVTGMGMLLVSLMDARGPEEKVKTEVPKERTIILIDTSASMLAEDVKPSRLHKASLIAKHFARKAIGHQLAIVAFAEIQKKIVPFTNDIDLIDARLESIKNLRNQYGSSALSAAIQESIQYFKEGDGEARGNILVITDGEETAAGIDLKVPNEIHVALVGVGTNNGGRIPLDDGRGFRYGYKKDRGQDVITKLNEKFFQRVVDDIPSAKYWLANSYTLPSDEIIDFFNAEMKKGLEKQDMVIRPVMMEWLVIPALVCFILAYAFKAVRVFTLGILLFMLPLQAQEEEKVELKPETIQKLSDLQKGELTQLEKIKLADDLYQSGAKAEAINLYEENMPLEKIDPAIPPEAYLNYGNALLEKNETQKGLGVYQTLSEGMDPKHPSASKIQDMIDRNTVTHFKAKEQKKKDEKNKSGQDPKDNKDQKQQGGQGQSDPKDGQSGKEQSKSGQGDKEQKDQQGKDQKDKKDGKGEEEKKDDPGEDPKDQENKDGQQPKEEAKAPPRKMPAKLKQLLSDDRALQMKVIENGTRDMNKKKSRTSKDW